LNYPTGHSKGLKSVHLVPLVSPQRCLHGFSGVGEPAYLHWR
jgi:hypothetical protein